MCGFYCFNYKSLAHTNTYMHACMYSDLNKYMSCIAHIHANLHGLHLCMHARKNAQSRMHRIYTCTLARTHTHRHIPTYLHACITTYMHPLHYVRGCTLTLPRNAASHDTKTHMPS